MSKFDEMFDNIKDGCEKAVKNMVEITAEATNNMNRWTVELEAWNRIKRLSNSGFADAIFTTIRELSIKTGKPFLWYCEDAIGRLARGDDKSEVLFYYDSLIWDLREKGRCK